MATITVKGLGQVKIDGDTPNSEEVEAIKRALLAKEEAPVVTPAMEEAVSPLVGLKERFEEVEAPLWSAEKLAGALRGGGGPPSIYGPEAEAMESAVGPIVRGVSSVPRMLLETGIAVSEAGPEWLGLGPEATRESPLYGAHEAWQEWEEGLYDVSPEDADIDIVTNKAMGGDVGPLMRLVGRGMVEAAPGMLVAIKQLPTYMGSLIGGYAKERAANRGSESVEIPDLVAALGTSAVVGAAEKASALKALGGMGAKTLPGAVGRGAVVEGAEEYSQGWLEAMGTQLGTRDDPEFWYGLDPAAAHKRGKHGFAVGAGTGGLLGAAGGARRGDPMWDEDARLREQLSRMEQARLWDEILGGEGPVAEGALPTPEVEALPAPAVAPALPAPAEAPPLALPAPEVDPSLVPSTLVEARAPVSIIEPERLPPPTPVVEAVPGEGPLPHEMTRDEFAATATELLHGTSRGFERFESKEAKDRYGKEQSVGERFYFTDQPAVARTFSDAGGFRQVDPYRFVDPDGGAIPDKGDMEALYDRLDKAIERGRTLAYASVDPGNEGKLVRVADPRDVPVDYYLDGDVRIYGKGRWPKVIKTNVYGRTLDLTDPDSYNADLDRVLKEEGRIDTSWLWGNLKGRLPAFTHEFSPALVKWARENNYGKVVVPDAYESGFKSTIALQEYIGHNYDPHREFVLRAIERGDIVPEGVLRDYPDMASAAGAPKALPAEAVPALEAIEAKEELDETVAESGKVARMLAEEQEVPPRPGAEGPGRAPSQPGATEASQRLRITAADVDSTTDELTTAIFEHEGARMAEEEGLDTRAQASAMRHIDNEARLIEVAEESGLSAEHIKTLTDGQRITFGEMLDKLDRQGMRSVVNPDGVTITTPDKVVDLIDRVNKEGAPLSSVELLALHTAYRSALRARDNIAKSLRDPNADIGTLQSRDNRLRVLELGALLAHRRGLSETGRALRTTQFIVDDVLNKVASQAKAILRKGKQLTPDEVEAHDKLWDKAEQAEDVADGVMVKAQIRLSDARAIWESVRERLRQRVKEIAPDVEIRRLTNEMNRATKEVNRAADDVQKAAVLKRKAKRGKAEVVSKLMDNPILRKYRWLHGATLVLNSVGDASSFGRQGLGLILQDWPGAFRTLPNIWKAAPWVPGHREFARAKTEELLRQPMQAVRNAGGMEMTEVEEMSNIESLPGDASSDKLNLREENFMFNMLDTGILGDALVVPSQNVFGLILNEMRTNNYDAGARILAEHHGADPANPQDILAKVPQEDLESLGYLINLSTGRSTWNPKNVVGALRWFMFAPRFTMSRLQSPWAALELMSGSGAFKNVSPGARKLFKDRMSREVGFRASQLLLIILAASDGPEEVRERVNNFFNPESGDFQKVRVGEWVFDLTAGGSATWRYLLPAAITPDVSDDVWPGVALRRREKGRDPYWDAWGQWVRNKAAPLMSGLLKMYPGINYRGRWIDELPPEQRSGVQFLEILREKNAIPPGMAETITGAEWGDEAKADGMLAWVLDRFLFPAAGAVTPIIVQGTADEWLQSATDKEEDAAKRLVPIVADFFGLKAAKYPASGPKSRLGVPRPPAAPKMPGVSR